MSVDYSQVVELCAQCLSLAMPIGVIFGLSSKVYNLFLSMVFGKERIKI